LPGLDAQFPDFQGAKDAWRAFQEETVRDGIRQQQAAQWLEVSAWTLSLWECDRLFPTAPYHARIVAYMGYDPFKMLGK